MRITSAVLTEQDSQDGCLLVLYYDGDRWWLGVCCRKVTKQAGTKETAETHKLQPVQVLQTGSEATSVDGPISDQMEEGLPSHVEERGMKSERTTGLINGVREQKGVGTPMEISAWMGSQSVVQQPSEIISWENTLAPKQTVATSNVNLEDARNLAAFSAVAEAMSSFNMQALRSQSLQMPLLFEQFYAEMKRNTMAGATVAPMDDSVCTEDLQTLTAELALARHGKKPPYCNCEGPECPDYLEWLEKKIQKASSKEQIRTSNQLSMNNAKPVVNGALPNQVPAAEETCSSTALLVPQNALPLSEERNVSPQTALVIEALTQLSSTPAQPSGDISTSSDTLPMPDLLGAKDPALMVPPYDLNLAQFSEVPINHVFQNQSCQPYPGQNLLQGPEVKLQQSWEQQRHPDQGETQYIPEHNILHNSSLQFNASEPTTEMSDAEKQWTEKVKSIGMGMPWMFQQSSMNSNPVAQLEQLLGDASKHYSKSALNTGKVSKKKKITKGKKSQRVTPVKLENGSDCYGIATTQVPPHPLSSGPVKHKAQKVLKKHLKHKRAMFLEQDKVQPDQQGMPNWWEHASQHLAAVQPEKKVRGRKKKIHLSLQNSMTPNNQHKSPRKHLKGRRLKKEPQSQFLPLRQISLESFHQQERIKQECAETPELTAHNIKKECAETSELTEHHPSSNVLSHQSQQPVSTSIAQQQFSNPLSLNVQTPCVTNPCNQNQACSFQGSVQPGPPVSSYMPLSVDSHPSFAVEQGETDQRRVNLEVTIDQNDTSSLDDAFEELIRQIEARLPPTFTSHKKRQQQHPQYSCKSNSGHQPAQRSSHSATLGLFSEQKTNLQSGTGTTHTKNIVTSAQQSPIVPNPVTLTEEIPRYKENSFIARPPKQAKIESSGAITVLSTTFQPQFCQNADGNSEAAKLVKTEPPFTPSLSGFIESPMQYLDAQTKKLLEYPAKKATGDYPVCDCVEQILEKDEGPYYTHLGSGPSVASIRKLMEERFGTTGKAIRIEKVLYTGKEGKSSMGCPIAKWVIRRASEEEKLLCLVRHRAGHHCENAVIIILIMAWEGIPRAFGDHLYKEITETITKYGNPTSRRCGLNDDRTCACQGKDPDTCGASFSFGCSWSMYFNGCKYARSKTPRKFRLQGYHPDEEDLLKDKLQALATKVAPLYKQLAPQAYQNQVTNEEVAKDCRLGFEEGRPFSGVTACMDFCAHAHKDQHNLFNGCTVVCTLTKEDNREVGKIPEDEQLHVLPLYKVSPTDEFDSEEHQQAKIKSGAIQVLTAFPREVRKLPEPAKTCRQRQLEARKAAAERRKLKKGMLMPSVKQEIMDMSCLQSPGLGLTSGLPHQQLKCIKSEPLDQYNTIKYKGNAVVESYSVLGNCRPSVPYGGNSVYSSYHSIYAQSNPSPINGFHSKFTLPPYGCYGYPGMLQSHFLNYGSNEVRPGPWANDSFDKKPNIHTLQDNPNFKNSKDHSEHSSHIVAKGNQYPSTLQESHGFGNTNTSSADHRTSHTPAENKQFAQNINCLRQMIKQESIDSFPYTETVPVATPNIHNTQTNSITSTARSSQVAGQHLWNSHTSNGNLSTFEKGCSENAWRTLQSNKNSKLLNLNTKEKLHSYKLTPNSTGLSDMPIQEKQWNSLTESGQATCPGTDDQGRSWSSCKIDEDMSTSSLSGLPNGNVMDNWSSISSVSGHSNYQSTPWSSHISESRGPTPSPGLYGKPWNSSCPSVSVVSSINSDKPFSQALQHGNFSLLNGLGLQQNHWNVYKSENNVEHTDEEHDREMEEVWSDSEHNFLDENIGGVAVAPGHGSVLIECARRELHATTPLNKPNRTHPTRISLVFYQHKNLCHPNHGLALWEAKVKLLAERARARQEEAARLGLQPDIKPFGRKRKWGGSSNNESSQNELKDSIPKRQAVAIPTNSVVTVSAYACTQVTGPFNRWI
ncbi:methylcytosine dioxygenase TET3 [Protopterus annectens]|uniref:methylcytosine dioxygenase TET3 n=1 Tax=Protopterus annectens TaxID=7888 RepID=UPI001CF97757|nr:methylcytosine dioxygenase TET3 [Protopterus annectens]